jgi:hypothetical protein
VPDRQAEWTVRLPDAVRPPFVVYVNGVRQAEGTDYRVRDRDLVFARELVKAQRLGLWRWFLGAWGIGTYGRDDQVDVSWSTNAGAPRVAHALEIRRSGEQPPARAPSS